MKLKDVMGTVYLARQDKGWTQFDLSENAGVGIQTVHRVENGKNITIEKLLMILNALGLELRVHQMPGMQ